MKKELEKVYDPSQVEGRIYDFWLKGGYFAAQVNPEKKPYTIVMPPPNITGQLHMGHALDNTVQDILIRFRRMQGYEALWVPGTDHASIATEAKIVQALRDEGIDKRELGREGFLKRAWAWKEQYGGRIVQQLKKIGCSCDWDRERFTLDEGCSKAVNQVFVKLYEKGLIYRGERIVNWCPTCRTTISDAEVEYEEKDGHFWHIRYPLSDGSGELQIATTRPETLLGDTALAVHPEDERYTAYVGKTVALPLVGREIPVVADSYVDREFGTGVVKITPAHDPNDFEVGKRHSLPIINVMNEDATINEQGGKYAGLTREAARKQIVKDLEQEGYLVRIEDHKHNVGSCYRCSTVIEPRVSKQWFVKMEPLAKPALQAVKEKQVRFVPERFEKIHNNWMENIRDWCISRQLWWGHRVPAWYCEDCGEIVVAACAPECCPKCQSHNLHQDPDTLDTWFSSALWPFSTLGWPEKTPELDYFYPTNTLVTAYDIIFFWVARMIFSGLEHTGKAPFDTVFIHGLIRDSQGRKMSKSLGNGVDPLKEIETFGADALRFTLATGNSPGNDMRYSEERVTASRNFANKLWNAARFILMNLTGEERLGLPQTLALEDKWVLSRYNRLVREVTDNLEKFELGVAVQKLYDFIWDIFCDWYIELAKTRLQAGAENAADARQVLVYVMTGVLQLLHPFMPFITEEIWQALPHEGESIMVSAWPEYRPELDFAQEEQNFERTMSVIRAVRNRRAEMNVPPSRKTRLLLETDFEQVLSQGVPFMQRLAFASGVEFVKDSTDSILHDAVQVITDSAKIYLPLDELIDKAKERERLEKELSNCQKDIELVQKKLQNESFVAKAPEKVVQNERDKLKAAQEKLVKLTESIRQLS